MQNKVRVDVEWLCAVCNEPIHSNENCCLWKCSCVWLPYISISIHSFSTASPYEKKNQLVLRGQTITEPNLDQIFFY